DNLNYPFVLLAQQLGAMGYKTATLDMDEINTFNAIVFIEFPGLQNAYFKKALKSGKDLYLITLESPLIKPDNYQKKNHSYFKKIFTWDDTLVDNITYFKINYSHHIPAALSFNSDSSKKLCVLIAGNKSSPHSLQLYSERIKAIRWFEQNHPEDFDLYGKGWDRHNFQGKFLGINIARLNRLTFLTKALRPYYPSYKGSINSKKETHSKYRFSICYENARDIPGYITEKIFDCFLAGCVPVYWGAPNITDHIPANTFIDRRNFPSYEALYSYLKNMPTAEYQGYLDGIKGFLASQQAYPFSAEYFTDTIIKNIVHE
ncbi:hypothetical protein KW786_03890, partial [Candidatus Parcubacteria bacterium]|nr:hypothetical protein [Candidatus Parcubacteria bacterium]